MAALLEGALPVSDEARRNAFRQIYVLTRLISLPGRPTDGQTTWDRIDSDAEDAFEAFYQALAGDMSREERARRDRAEVEAIQL